MKYFYIIAGNLQEAIDWVNKKIQTQEFTSPPLYVSDPAQIVDENPNGIFIGTWRTRKNLPEIFLRLTNKTCYGTDKMTVLVNLWESIKNEI